MIGALIPVSMEVLIMIGAFDTSKYGGFMDSYNTAIVVWGKADDIDETNY